MSIPSTRIHRILQIILVSCLVILLRVWHLTVIQREERLAQAQKPQSRTLLLKADRGTICDRFQTPLALNKISYNAAIYYGQINQIPTVAWKETAQGERLKIFPRKEYIQKLCQNLGKTLHLEPFRLEDLIYSKASLFPHAPFIIKAGISEKEHYELKALEKDWLGIHAEIGAERFYPLGKTACHVIGTMGAINQKEYEKIREETACLEKAIELYTQGLEWTLPKGFDSFEAVYQRLHELKEKAYRFNDLVGKSGVEGRFEEELRGYFGKKSFEIDQKGRFVRELPGTKSAVPGRQIVLSISAELQQYAESLLAKSEQEREGRTFAIDPVDHQKKVQKQPWIKGGAIVVLDPNNGEVLAWASHPRFDPNDFISSANLSTRLLKQKHVCRWLENERYIASIWDGKDVLVRERYNRKFIEEEKYLDWNSYLSLILSEESPVKDFFHKIDSIKGAIHIQEDFEELLYFAPLLNPLSLLEELFSPNPKLTLAPDATAAKKRLQEALQMIPDAKDKLFAIDLCRLAVDSTRFSDALLKEMGLCKLNQYRQWTQGFQKISYLTKEFYQKKFHDEEFPKWRKENEKEFLSQKRKEEKEMKTYPRPYLDYLDKKEKELFQLFWEDQKFPLLNSFANEDPSLKKVLEPLAYELRLEFLKTFRSFKELDRPLLGSYPQLTSRGGKIEKDLAASFYPQGGFGFTRSYAFQTSAPLGSIFKLVTGYEGLKQGAHFSIIDKMGKDAQLSAGKNEIVAFGLNQTPYHRIYKGGRLPKSSSPHIGKIDLMGALEQSSNPYFAILAGDFLSDPNDLAEAAVLFGFGEKSGIDLPGEVKGNIPTDLKTNRTGLYSFAIGQHTFLSTPVQAAVMLSALANGGKILKPKIVVESTGLLPDRKPLSAFSSANTFAKKELSALGIEYPLFTKMEPRIPLSSPQEQPTVIKRTAPLPSSIRSSILGGMDLVVWGAKGGSRASMIRSLRTTPSLLQNYLSLQHQMIGKTGTAELLFNPNINPSSKAQMYKHTWFGAISFAPDAAGKIDQSHPELVIVVFSRYGEAGREGAPIAAQLIHKWREIQKKNSQ